MYRLYTEVKVSTRFIKPRAEGTRFDKSSRDSTEVYNALLPWYHAIATHFIRARNTVTKQIFARGNSITVYIISLTYGYSVGFCDSLDK